MNLIEHMESRLGRLAEGWSVDPDSNPMPFQLGRFQDGTLPGVVTYATIGLGKHALTSRTSGRGIHQELLLSVRSENASGVFPALIHQLAMGLLEHGDAILRGDVIGPRGAIIPESSLEAFYAAIPVYYDDAFAAVDLESGSRTVMVWMVPIGKSEAAFVAKAGWAAFESKLAEQDPDLLDLKRSEIRLDM
ncbi:suppressor of fused domain protein [Streptomyces lannensis]|uniref:Suppressor of fused-like domain-containing protein n=1 Tax=Streptomyces lannensis TaxID=766498 RepID=A0ABP7LPJ1_9ACTN